LKIGSGFRRLPLPIGTSNNLRVGQKVYAIGNPFGLDWTLTTGIVSAMDSSLKCETGVIEHLIQTDAAINPGNSVGQLLDYAGRLIGVNTAIYSQSGASAGVGFALPVDTVNRVVPQLIGQRKYSRPSLGIEIDQDLNAFITSQLEGKGVAVLRVLPNSTAAPAGLKGLQVNANRTYTPGDIITAVEDKPVNDIAELLARLDDFKIVQTVIVSILRNERTIKFDVELQAE
jgi:S1-C subfamily serine protease